VLCVVAELQQLLGVDLGCISSFLSMAVSSSDRLQDELSLITMRLCCNNPAALRAVCSQRRKVAVSDAAGAPTDLEATGLDLVKRLLLNGSELSRACACGLLGELALYPDSTMDSSLMPESAATSEEEADVTSLPGQAVARPPPLIRAQLLHDRTIDVMLEVLYEVTTLLVKSGGLREAPAAAMTAVTPRQSRRASMKAAAAVRPLLLLLQRYLCHNKPCAEENGDDSSRQVATSHNGDSAGLQMSTQTYARSQDVLMGLRELLFVCHAIVSGALESGQH
jgi:hypothetical protein